MSEIIYSVPFGQTTTTISARVKTGIKTAVANLTGSPTIILDAFVVRSRNVELALALSTARATAVRDYIVSIGYPPHKVLTRTYGDRVPGGVVTKRLSRRVDLLALT